MIFVGPFQTRIVCDFEILISAFMQVCPDRKNLAPLQLQEQRYLASSFVRRSTDPTQNTGSVNITTEGVRERPAVWDMFRGGTEHLLQHKILFVQKVIF